MADVSDEEWARFQRGLHDDQAGPATGGMSTQTVVNAAASLELARQELIENAPFAAAQITQLARFASNERVRLDASKYVLERTLGPAGQKIEGAKGPLQQMMDDLFSEAEEFANTGAEDEQK
jgi:hypothetical protein